MDAGSFVREEIPLGDLIQLRKCRKSLEFSELSLNYSGFETTKVIMKAFSMLKTLKVITKESAFKIIEEVFYKDYLKEWFDFQYQYEQVLERDMTRVKRVIEYICNNKYTLLDTDVPFKVQIQSQYRGYSINYITGKVDFVFGKGENVIFVNIRPGVNPYTHRARKISTHVENSQELLGTALGVKNLYPGKNCYVESWYLNNKDDKSFSLEPIFEHKKGKNIASIYIGDVSVSELRKRFYAVAALPEDGLEGCDECIHNRVCKVSQSITIARPASENTKGNMPAAMPEFTNSQKAVIGHMEGPMCVIAVPGAGKTTSLVHRLANMLRKGIRPENILFVTFTNKAAGEIKERVMALLGTDNEANIPNIYTFNALGYNILKENPMLLGKRVRLADKTDRYMLIAGAMARAPKISKVSYDGIYSDHGLIKQLDSWFNQIEEFGKDEFISKYSNDKDVAGILKVYSLYKEEFHAKGYIDFDMQISLVNEIFKKYPALPISYSKKFKYIMVDEFQDTSADQAAMIYAIAKKHSNIVVVGDDDQSIYGWRGGSNKFMLNFGEDYPNAKIMIMNDNFRSASPILETANEVIADNGNRYAKVIKGHKEASYKPIYLKKGTAASVRYLIGEILKKGYCAGDIAVLARNNKRLAEVMDALDGYYKVSISNMTVIEDPVFQTLIDVFSLYYDGFNNDEAFYRFLNINGVGQLSKRFREASLYENLVLTNLLLPIDKMDIACRYIYNKYKDVSVLMAAGHKLINCFKIIQYGRGISVLNDILSILFGITEHKVLNILYDIADERALVTVADMYAYMKSMLLYGCDKTIEYDVNKEAVNLLTCHGSKGKEFPVVIVYGTEDFNSDEEEVRLFYVSITRAKNTLFFVETDGMCELFPKIERNVLVKGGSI